MDINRKSTIAAMILLGFASVEFIGLKPLILSAYKEFLGMDDQIAGLIVALETAGGVIGTVAVMFRINSFDRRVMALAALVIIIVGNLVSILVFSLWPLSILRFLTGLGEGIALGVMSGTLAATKQPDRNFAIYTASVLALMSLTVLSVPTLLGYFNISGIYLLLMVCCLPSLLTLKFVPRLVSENLSSSMSFSNVLSDLPLRGLILVLAGGFLSYLAIGGFAPFMAEISKLNGLSEQAVANLLSVGQLFGLLGALLAAWQSMRWGRLIPLTAAQGIMAICLLSLLLFPVQTLVVVVVIPVFQFSWLYFFSFLAGLASEFDPKGRTTILTFSVTNMGFVIGPILGGYISVATGGYGALELFGLTTLFLSIPCLLYVARRLDDESGKGIMRLLSKSNA